MADVKDKIDGKVVILYISTNTVTPAYDSVVCKIDGGLAMTSNVNTVENSCGIAKARGAANYSITGSLAANTAPGTGELSAEDLIVLADSGAEFLWKYADDPTTPNLYRQGTGFFSSYSETYNYGDVVKADFTIDVIGSVDVTPS
jgi:hypothetical protein